MTDLPHRINRLIEEATAERKATFNKKWLNKTIGRLEEAMSFAHMINKDEPPELTAADALSAPAPASADPLTGCRCETSTTPGGPTYRVNRNCPIHGLDSIQF